MTGMSSWRDDIQLVPFSRTHSTRPCMSPAVFSPEFFFRWQVCLNASQAQRANRTLSEVKHVCKTIETQKMFLLFRSKKSSKIRISAKWKSVSGQVVFSKCFWPKCSAKCFWRRTSVSAQVVFARPCSHLFGRKITTSWTEESEWTTKGGFVHGWHQKLFLHRLWITCCSSLKCNSIT